MPQPRDSIRDDYEIAARVRDVIDDCLRNRAAGQALSDDALIAAHPDLMPQLGKVLLNIRSGAGVREFADSDVGPDVETAPHYYTETAPGSLKVRCPKCRAPIELAADTVVTDLTCAACGTHFSLVDPGQAERLPLSLSKLGRFDLVERLGVGAFSSVWKARDTELDRTVAIKIPRHVSMTADEQKHFFRGARAAAQLRHPNIESVYEVGRDGDFLYMVSDFIDGVTLLEWSTDKQLTNREAAELCAKIADAVDHAHEHGIVHRDLKPANIIIDGDGQPHLTDFSLARREMGEVTLTLEGHILGTPAYMSPEQAQGESHTADRSSDIYSLGVILFQLLTGELPFRGNVRMLLHQVIHDPPPNPRTLNNEISRELAAITLKCLEKDPNRRYESARALTADLRCYVAGKPILARGTGLAQRAWRMVERWRSFTKRSAKTVSRKNEIEQTTNLPSRQESDWLHFTVTSPKTLQAGAASIVDVWAHLFSQRGEVLKLACEVRGRGLVTAGSKGPIPVAPGTRIDIQLHVPGCTVSPVEDTIFWHGDIANASFSVTVPNRVSAGSKACEAVVRIEGLSIARIAFVLHIGSERGKVVAMDSQVNRIRSAFASYASKDRDAVLGRIQGMLKEAPGLDVFVDIARLKSGERWPERLREEILARDVLYLFWSKAASESEWVEKEWRCGYAERGIDFIDPVPLVSPDVVPPPNELSKLHFNDWVLAFMRGQPD